MEDNLPRAIVWIHRPCNLLLENFLPESGKMSCSRTYFCLQISQGRYEQPDIQSATTSLACQRKCRSERYVAVNAYYPIRMIFSNCFL